MNTSESVANIGAALSLFQSQVPLIPKARTAKIPGKNDKPGYSYKYADLGDINSGIRETMAANGLSYTQSVGSDGQSVMCITMLLHTSGEFIESDAFMLPQGATPQTAGSAATYARRYSLSGTIGVASEEDDDGAAATHSADARSASPAPRSAPQSAKATNDAPAGSAASSELASEGQIKAVFGKGKALGWTSEKTTASVQKSGGKHPDQLTKTEVRKVLDGLQALIDKQEAPAVPGDDTPDIEF